MATRKGALDFYAKEAKRLGYVARSALKLTEMCDKFGVLRGCASVLDLGCHPGAWLQVACRESPNGIILGVDLAETDVRGARHVDERRVATVAMDARDFDARTVARAWRERAGRDDAPRAFHAVLSDMAPATTGNRTTDAARSYELAEQAVRIALGERALAALDDDDDDDDDRSDVSGAADPDEPSASPSETPLPRGGVLRRGGNLVVKLLEGPGGGREDLQRVCRPAFETVRWFRPKATRRESKEVFLIATRRRVHSSSEGRPHGASASASAGISTM
jgi:23S rRNA U2552 (ribose-2'-O)-methylase RlmE/FtsJ